MPITKASLLTGMSAVELRKLAATKDQLDKLEGLRAKLSMDLTKVNKDIAKLLGSLTGKKKTRKKTAKKRVAKKAGRKKVVKAAPKKKTVQVRKKRAGRKVAAKKTKTPRVTVESVVVGLLKGKQKPMAFQDILSTIQKKKLVTSKSKNFANVLRRTLSTSKKVKRVSRGIYKA